ncbi:hypothetical protein NXF25_001776 [Crotalus adamanteus]|uniref:Uncharacterized protein n=1 Tax=Crotalus adamanteus TaxID=8729 RepID=A0AAW1C928_CROAD
MNVICMDSVARHVKILMDHISAAV